LQRGYVLLLAGGAIVAAGLAASVYYVGAFLSEIEKTGVHIVAPRGSFETVQGINGTHGAYFVAFPGYDENPVRASIKVTGPSGSMVIEREIDLPFYSEQFAAQSAGNYTLAISNTSESTFQVAAIIGDPQAISEIVGSSTITSSAMASFIVVAGIAALAVGGVFVIIDRRKAQKMKHYGDVSDLK
jgi:hypothetical protein